MAYLLIFACLMVSVPCFAPDDTVVRAQMHRIVRNEGSAARRQAAVAALSDPRVANEESVQILTELLFPTALSTQWPVQAQVAEEAARTLGRLAANGSDVLSTPDALALLIRRAEEAPAWVRSAAVEGVFLLGNDLAAVQEALASFVLSRNPSFPEEVRLRAIELLWIDGRPWTLPVLTRALDDRHSQVFLRACEAMVARGRGNEVRGALEAAARRRDLGQSDRERIARLRTRSEPEARLPEPVPGTASCGVFLSLLDIAP